MVDPLDPKHSETDHVSEKDRMHVQQSAHEADLIHVVGQVDLQRQQRDDNREYRICKQVKAHERPQLTHATAARIVCHANTPPLFHLWAKND
jgi:hypothetical protein